jgi:hypothetical protein
MPSSIYKPALVLAILCVLAVFLAPTVDLPETALRAKQIAVVIFAALACMAVLSIVPLTPLSLFHMSGMTPASMASDHASLLCTFLC